MLRVTIEIIPKDGRVRTVGQIQISNDQSGSASVSNHNATVLTPTPDG